MLETRPPVRFRRPRATETRARRLLRGGGARRSPAVALPRSYVAETLRRDANDDARRPYRPSSLAKAPAEPRPASSPKSNRPTSGSECAFRRVVAARRRNSSGLSHASSANPSRSFAMYFSRCARRREARRTDASSSANGVGIALSRERRSRSFLNPPEPARSASADASDRRDGERSSEDSLASSLEPRRASRRSASARLERAPRGAESFSSPQLAPRDAARASPPEAPSEAPSRPKVGGFARRDAVAGTVGSFRPSARLDPAAVASRGAPDRARVDPGASGDGGARGGVRGGRAGRSFLPKLSCFVPGAETFGASDASVDASISAPASANESSSGSVAADASAGRRRERAWEVRPEGLRSSSGSVAASPALANPPSRLSVSEPSAAADANASAASLWASSTRDGFAVSRCSPFAFAPRGTVVNDGEGPSASSGRRAATASPST